MGGGGKIEVVSKKKAFLLAFYEKSENKKAHFLRFGDIRVGRGGNFQLSPGDKI